MANTTAGVVAGVAILTGVATRIDAAQGAEMAVVLHVTADAHIPPSVLAVAEEQAARVYQAAGVQLIWTDGAARTAQPDGAFHMDVVVVRSKDMRPVESQSKRIDGEVFGRALRPIRRASIFYDRIYDHATLTGSNVAHLLAAVIAHEVGHLLLPAFSHSPTGIMRAHWEGPIWHVPNFTVEQGRTIRTRLADSSTK